MNFSKSSLLSVFALFLTLAVCYAKEAENASKAEAAVAATDDKASDVEGIKNDKPDGASTEAGTSDFDIEQLLKLIDALKNQDFEEVDKTLNDSKLGGDDASKAEKKAADKKRFNENLEEDKDLDTSASSTDFEEKAEL